MWWWAVDSFVHVSLRMIYQCQWYSEIWEQLMLLQVDMAAPLKVSRKNIASCMVKITYFETLTSQPQEFIIFLWVSWRINMACYKKIFPPFKCYLYTKLDGRAKISHVSLTSLLFLFLCGVPWQFNVSFWQFRNLQYYLFYKLKYIWTLPCFKFIKIIT